MREPRLLTKQRSSHSVNMASRILSGLGQRQALSLLSLRLHTADADEISNRMMQFLLVTSSLFSCGKSNCISNNA